MNWKINILISILFISACRNDHSIEADPIQNQYLIEVDELETIANQSHIKILDFRKKEFYAEGHIPGALNIWRSDIEDDSYDYKGMMASKTQIETLFGQLGITADDMLIIYDDNGLCDASRLWWLLQNYNFTNVQLLHGGMTAWKAIDARISTEIPVIKESIFKFSGKAKMQYYASKEQTQKALENNVFILDTRTSDEFSGKRQKKGAAKGGRIPKSIHIDWAEAINYNGDKRIKSQEDLEDIYGPLNMAKNDSIIVYCHSGVRSAHTSFVLSQLLGYKNVRNYDGSWTEWSYFDDSSVERDSLVTIF